MDCAAQLPCTFPMDDPYLKNTLLTAQGEIVGDEFPDFPRLKGVQVKHAVYGNLNSPYLIHYAIIH